MTTRDVTPPSLRSAQSETDPAHTLTTTLAAGLVGPPLLIGLSAAGIPTRVGIVLLVAAVGAAIWRMRAGLHTQLLDLRRRYGAPILIGFTLALALATFYNVRLSRFMADARRTDLSVLERQFFREHSCLSSYTEAALVAPAGLNVYEIERYADVVKPGEYRDRYIGPFVIDLYQYPPAFLILPRAAVAAGMDFYRIRSAWFFVQSALLFAAMALLARWIGGVRGTTLLLLMPLLWLAPTTRVGLQSGNFQLTAFPLAVLAMIGFDRGRHAAGGLGLGFAAISKIFPGVLGLVLIGTRRWKAVAWTVACSVALTALAWAFIGSRPFVDFVHYQMPRIESGEAFFWIEKPEFAPVNHSVYGLVTKLRLLGVPLTGQAAANHVSSVYALLVFVLAGFAGWRLARFRSAAESSDFVRLRHAQIWLGLLSLASFRSPFVPDAYGFVGTIWLLTLVAAERQWRARMWMALAAAGIAFCLVLDGGLVPSPVPTSMVLITLAIQTMAIGLNTMVVLREP